MLRPELPSTASAPPVWLVAAKVALAALLVVGAAFPDVGGFEGKGMIYRLPIFLAPALVLPIRWLLRRRQRDRVSESPPRPYPVALDAGLTIPFLLDTAANAVGLYDHVDQTDDVLHFVNWFVLFGGVAVALAAARTVVASRPPRWLVWLAAAGIGGAAAILWEVAEYAVMRSGVGGLSLTYGDTLADLVLSTTGGVVGAWGALRWLVPEPAPRPTASG